MKIENINTLRSIILMWLARDPTSKDWEIIKKLIRTLATAINKPELIKWARRADNLAIYQITDLLGIDDEEKQLIFQDLFCDENERTQERRKQDDKLHEEEEY